MIRTQQDIRLSQHITKLFNNLLRDEYYFVVPTEQIKFSNMDARDFYNCTALMRANQRIADALEYDTERKEERDGAIERAKFFEGIIDAEIKRVNKILSEKNKV